MMLLDLPVASYDSPGN